MEALLRAISDLIAEKDTKISLLKWEVEKLQKEIKELKNDIKKYEENEAIMMGFDKGENK